MKRLPLALLALGAVLALGFLSSVVTQGFRSMAEAEHERSLLVEEKARLEHEISRLEATLEGMRTDPEAVESMARDELGWIRPDEVVLVLATPTPAPLPVSAADPTPTPIFSVAR